MAHPFKSLTSTTVSAGQSLVLSKPGELSPALAALKKATGLDPRHKRQGCTYLLLDVSSSMAGAPLREAVEGAKRFNTDCLASGQMVGLIAFGTEAWVLAKPTRDGIARQLALLQCNGSTNMAAAIALAISNLAGQRGNHTLVLATDGYADDAEATLQAATRAKTAGLRLLTIGTADSDTDFLNRMASSAELAVVTARGALGKAIAASARLLLV